MKRLLLVLALAAGCSAPAAAVSIVETVDGDTIRIDGASIRILGIDTPETWRAHCEAEYMAGLSAKRRLQALLASGAVTYYAEGTDRFQRLLARVYVGSTNVADVLLREGYALVYIPGPKAKLQRIRAWCGAGADFNDVYHQPKGL